MVTRSNILYSVSAVKRLLGLGDRVFVKIQEFANVVWVWVKGKRPTFISKKAFKQHFVDRRKAQANGLVVTQNVNCNATFTVKNETKGNSYQTAIYETAIACECEDYQNQKEFFGRGVCKHGYAVLAHLGFSSLKDYISSLYF
jgi:hypothetical protein